MMNRPGRAWLRALSAAGCGAGVFVVLLIAVGRPADSPLVVSAREARDIERSRATIRISRGDTLPAFDLPSTTGARMTPRALRGHPSAIVFVTARCPYCARFAEQASDVLGTAPRPDVLVICSGRSAEAQEFAQKVTAGVAVAADSGGVTMTTFGVESVPAAILIDEETRLIRSTSGLPRVLRALERLERP